jgi:hypothetical protein
VATKIVETEEEFNQDFFPSWEKADERIVCPVPRTTEKHPAQTEYSFVYVRLYPTGNKYVLSKTHRDCGRVPEKYVSRLYESPVYAFDYKRCRHLSGFKNVRDVNLKRFIDGEDLVKVKLKHKRKFNKLDFPLDFVPIYKLTDQLAKYTSKASKDVGSETFSSLVYRNYLNTVVENFRKIESNGLYVNEKMWNKEHGKPHLVDENGLAYSNYDIYTSTGRPSNAFGNVNYAAINKEDGSRKKYESRFEDGTLVNLDYDAFHLRLVAELIGYEFEEKSAHTYLGKKYFDTENLTDEQYEESKKLSFRYLYGSTVEESLKYEFFHRSEKLKKKLWKLYKKHGFIETPVYRRRIRNIKNPSKSKVFNYLLQSHETEVASKSLQNMLSVSKNRSDVYISLYTYDSVLVDMKEFDRDLVDRLRSKMEVHNHRAKVYAGSNYNEMKKI